MHRKLYGTALLSLLLIAFASNFGISAEPFAIRSVHRHRFIETALSGAQKVYEGYAAEIDAHDGISPEEMERFGQSLFETRLRSMTEAERGNHVWITFNFKEGEHIQGQFAHKTYRVIFTLESGAWRHL